MIRMDIIFMFIVCIYKRVELLAPMTLYSTFCRHANFVYQTGCNTTGNIWAFKFFYIPDKSCYCLSIHWHLGKTKWVSHFGFVWYLHISNDIEFAFTSIPVIYRSAFEKYLFKSFAHYSNSYVIFKSLISCTSCSMLYILWVIFFLS